MEENDIPKKNQEQVAKKVEEKLRIEGKFKGGANWFFWIAGLSIINSFILLLGGNWSFIAGLGITQLMDAIALEAINQYGEGAVVIKGIAFAFDMVVAGIFILFGVFARKKHKWAFIVGMVVYALDALLLLFIQYYLGIIFHGLVLFWIWGGLKGRDQLMELEKEIELMTAPEANL